jgi:hypothetical protein
MPEQKIQKVSDAQAKLRLAYAAETRRFEIERFWQRSLFFWTILGAAFIGYAALANKDEGARLAISCFGIVASLAWTLQNRGAKYWHEAWEQKTERHQLAALGVDLFSGIEPVKSGGWFGARRFSVSKISIILSDFTVVVWLGITGQLVSGRLAAACPNAKSILEWIEAWSVPTLLVITTLFCVLLLCCGRSGVPKDPA